MGWYFGFKLHLMCNERGEILNFMLTKANVDDWDKNVFNRLTDNVFGKLFADKGYISQGLFERLFNDGINLVTGISFIDSICIPVVITNVSIAIRFLRIMQQGARVQWDGILDSNYILSIMKEVRFLTLCLLKQMLMTGMRDYQWWTEECSSISAFKA